MLPSMVPATLFKSWRWKLPSLSTQRKTTGMSVHSRSAHAPCCQAWCLPHYLQELETVHVRMLHISKQHSWLVNQASYNFHLTFDLFLKRCSKVSKFHNILIGCLIWSTQYGGIKSKCPNIESYTPPLLCRQGDNSAIVATDSQKNTGNPDRKIQRRHSDENPMCPFI